jgi:hypothetical protein
MQERVAEHFNFRSVLETKPSGSIHRWAQADTGLSRVLSEHNQSVPTVWMGSATYHG